MPRDLRPIVTIRARRYSLVRLAARVLWQMLKLLVWLGRISREDKNRIQTQFQKRTMHYWVEFVRA